MLDTLEQCSIIRSIKGQSSLLMANGEMGMTKTQQRILRLLQNEQYIYGEHENAAAFNEGIEKVATLVKAETDAAKLVESLKHELKRGMGISLGDPICYWNDAIRSGIDIVISVATKNQLPKRSTQEVILHAIRHNPQITVRKLQEICEASSPSVIQHHLDKLQTKGVLKKVNRWEIIRKADQ